MKTDHQPVLSRIVKRIGVKKACDEEARIIVISKQLFLIFVLFVVAI